MRTSGVCMDGRRGVLSLPVLHVTRRDTYIAFLFAEFNTQYSRLLNTTWCLCFLLIFLLLTFTSRSCCDAHTLQGLMVGSVFKDVLADLVAVAHPLTQAVVEVMANRTLVGVTFYGSAPGRARCV